MTGSIVGIQNPMVGITYSYEVQPSGLSFGLRGEYEWYKYGFLELASYYIVLPSK